MPTKDSPLILMALLGDALASNVVRQIRIDHIRYDKERNNLAVD